jgi:hypothetical protein
LSHDEPSIYAVNSRKIDDRQLLPDAQRAHVFGNRASSVQIGRVQTPADNIASTESSLTQQEQSGHERSPRAMEPSAEYVAEPSPVNYPQHAAAIEDRMLDADWREFFNARYNKCDQ